jgi:Cu-processing system permease protein
MTIASSNAAAERVTRRVPRTAAKVMKYEVRDVLRSRSLIGYTLFFLIGTDALLRFSGDRTNALLSEMNVVLALVPLVALVFGTMYLFEAREFIELLLAQPVGRGSLFTGLYLGLAGPLSLGLVVGVGVPFLLHGLEDAAQRATLLVLLGVGVALTFAFTGVAFLLALRIGEKAKALGSAIGIWLFVTLLYDGLVLLVATMFADYPLERALLGLMLANPVDLARVLLLLRLDVSALMGYTGAVFKSFFGSTGGALLALAVLLCWTAAPVFYAKRLFLKKDF